MRAKSQKVNRALSRREKLLRSYYKKYVLDRSKNKETKPLGTDCQEK